MNFDRYLRYNSHLVIEGNKITDAILFKIESYPMTQKDGNEYLAQLRRYTLHHLRIYKDVLDEMPEKKKNLMCVDHAGLESIQNYSGLTKTRKLTPGEYGGFNFNNAMPPFKNIVFQYRIGPGQNYKYNLIWLVMLPTDKDGARRFSFVDLLTLYDDDLIRLDWYEYDGFFDIGETYIKHLSGESMPYNAAAKIMLILNFQTALKIISIINCKNVEYTETKRQPKLNKKRVKKGKAPLRNYYTLEIKGRKIYSDSNNKNSKYTDTRLHMCRGHFKEYTTEKPLFGKYIGTFWWQDQMRGDSKKGEIKKDYALP